jgi:acyl dehydratase
MPRMAGPTVIPDIASIKEFIDQPLGETEWLTVSQEQIDAFAKATGDNQWIHVDVERAKRESPFKGTIAHGYLTLALIPVLLSRLLVVANTTNIVNYGIDKLRLPRPVPAGARGRRKAKIKAVRDLPKGAARVVMTVAFEVEGMRKAALTGDVVYAYFP